MNKQPESHAQMLERFRLMMQPDCNRLFIFRWSPATRRRLVRSTSRWLHAQGLPGSDLLFHQANPNATTPCSPIAGDCYSSVVQLLVIPDGTDTPLIMGEDRPAFGTGTGSFHTFWDDTLLQSRIRRKASDPS